MKFQEIKELTQKPVFLKFVNDRLSRNVITASGVVYQFLYSFDWENNEVVSLEMVSLIPNTIFWRITSIETFTHRSHNKYRNYISVIKKVIGGITKDIIDYKLPDEPSDEEKELYSVTSVIAPLIAKLN